VTELATFWPPLSSDQTKYIKPRTNAMVAIQRHFTPVRGLEDMYMREEPARGVCELSTMLLTFLAGLGRSLA